MVKLSKRKLRRVGVGLARVGLGVLAFLAVSWGLYTVGVRVTPPGSPPVIYAPSVQRTETYRRRAVAWLAQLQALDTDVVTLVDHPPVDVYTLAQRAQQTLETAAAVSQAVSLLYPPASLTSLWDDLQTTADLYLEATAMLNHWVGEPTDALYLGILEAVRIARSARAELEANPWLTDAGAKLSLEVEPSGINLAVPVNGTPQWGE